MLSTGVSCRGFRSRSEICRLWFVTKLIIDLFEGVFKIVLRSRRAIALQLMMSTITMATTNGSSSR